MYKITLIKRKTIFWLSLVGIAIIGCTSENQNTNKQLTNDELQIHKLHNEYVKGWKEMNEEKVMNLLEKNSMIQPNSLTPIIGKENIREFWFPKDSSITIINNFDTEIISLHLRDSIAIMTHVSNLDWDYRKDTLNFGMIQKGINTTIYRKQIDNDWRIWRSMWTDILANQK